MPKRKHVHVPVVEAPRQLSDVTPFIPNLRRCVESALGWPPGVCAKLRELTECEREREEIRKRRAAKANRTANLIDLCRLLRIPVPAVDGTPRKPAVANTSQVDNHQDNATPKTKGRR
jgi:hypothetical protein